MTPNDSSENQNDNDSPKACQQPLRKGVRNRPGRTNCEQRPNLHLIRQEIPYAWPGKLVLQKRGNLRLTELVLVDGLLKELAFLVRRTCPECLPPVRRAEVARFLYHQTGSPISYPRIVEVRKTLKGEAISKRFTEVIWAEPEGGPLKGGQKESCCLPLSFAQKLAARNKVDLTSETTTITTTKTPSNSFGSVLTLKKEKAL
ncbi:hypothetical protein MC885_011541 [Smutsia gigantea]|nr:hypothetical protein MC885_011541 [Smutsia gigantea]